MPTTDSTRRDIQAATIRERVHGLGKEFLDFEFLRQWRREWEEDSTRSKEVPTTFQCPRATPSTTIQALPFPEGVIEECRRLKSRLGALHPDARFRSLLFASALADEGTSTIVSILASVMARGSREPILLIDGNLRNPSLHRRFEVPLAIGLSDLVANGARLEQAVKATGLPHLYVVTSGPGLTDPSALLESPELEQWLIRMESRFKLILIDAPPATLYPDAYLWGKLVDGVVLVLRAHRTRAKVVEAVKQEFLQQGCHLWGVVLNRRRYFIPRWLYERL